MPTLITLFILFIKLINTTHKHLSLSHTYMFFFLYEYIYFYKAPKYSFADLVQTPKAVQVNNDALPAEENGPIVRNNTVTKDDQGLNGTLNSSMIRHRKGKLTC